MSENGEVRDDEDQVDETSAEIVLENPKVPMTKEQKEALAANLGRYLWDS